MLSYQKNAGNKGDYLNAKTVTAELKVGFKLR